MKWVLILFFISFSSTSYSQIQNIDSFIIAFNNLRSQDIRRNQEEYFRLFPKSYTDFIQVFGDGYEIKGILGEQYQLYVPQYFALFEISEEEKMRAWIDIAIEGEWALGATSDFAYILRNKVLTNTALVYGILSSKSSSQIECFYRFLFQNVNMEFLNLPKELSDYKEIDREYYNSMNSGLNLAIQDSSIIVKRYLYKYSTRFCAIGNLMVNMMEQLKIYFYSRKNNVHTVNPGYQTKNSASNAYTEVIAQLVNIQIEIGEEGISPYLQIANGVKDLLNREFLPGDNFQEPEDWINNTVLKVNLIKEELCKQN
ncbi:MAG: hypothetical protein HRT72_06695 [Flavobacteriales bacterium]|nr:hypothetical protein [Flavobacteriales bacterium]